MKINQYLYDSKTNPIESIHPNFDTQLVLLFGSREVFEKKEIFKNETYKTKIRGRVHILIAMVFAGVILLFQLINKGSVINELFRAAGYTYGPLLGLFAFGLLTKRKIKDRYALLVCLLTPVLSYVLNMNSAKWFDGLTFGFLILAVNGALTFGGLLLISSPPLPPKGGK